MSLLPCPAFILPLTGNQIFDSLRQKQAYVLYFYPKDNTAGCTTESEDFRDFHKAFTQANCAIFGVSRDSIKSHENFKAKLQLPFGLISDPDGIACEAFSVMKMKVMYGKAVKGIERSTFVIDKHGNIAKEYRNVKVPGHVEEVLAFVQTL
jgi:peroxiredoxin Q/BCP